MRERFNDMLIERLSCDSRNLERLNLLLLEAEGFVSCKRAEGDQWRLQPHERAYYKGVPEVEREVIQDCFLGIRGLWTHLSRGANTVPKGTVDMIKDFLGESGLQCFNNVFLPMEEHTAPNVFNEETFWFCWIKFLKISMAQAGLNGRKNDEDSEGSDKEFNAQDTSDGRNIKGVVEIILKSAKNLLPMDTFSGKADPYLVVTVDGDTQKSSINRC